MVASDFAFLVLGMVLGVPAGAALLVAMGAGPHARRVVRLIVVPNSVPRRRAATLADDPFGESSWSPAAGGPADTGRPPGGGSTRPSPVAESRTPVQAMAARAGSYGVRHAVGYGQAPEPWRTRDRPSTVGLAVGAGMDPMLAAIHGAPPKPTPRLARTCCRAPTTRGSPRSNPRPRPALPSSRPRSRRVARAWRSSRGRAGAAPIAQRTAPRAPCPADRGMLPDLPRQAHLRTVAMARPPARSPTARAARSDGRPPRCVPSPPACRCSR